jgi:hypothetical protein
LNFDDVNKALILPTNDCSFVDHRNCKYEVLSRNFVNYVKVFGVDHVKQLFLCSDKEVLADHNAESHILDIEFFYSLRVASFKNVDLVLVVYCDYVISADCVYVTSCLSFVLAVQLWLSLLQ